MDDFVEIDTGQAPEAIGNTYCWQSFIHWVDIVKFFKLTGAAAHLACEMQPHDIQVEEMHYELWAFIPEHAYFLCKEKQINEIANCLTQFYGVHTTIQFYHLQGKVQ